MTPERFQDITSRYPGLHIAVVGDFCLDRYLEIDPRREETSIETGRPVHNVVRVRSQPGGAGTILNNLVALGVGRLQVVGFSGDDGEGYELRGALELMPGVSLDHFQTTVLRRTFTYCKPLLMHSDRPPEELNRLDSKNWDPTPPEIEEATVASVRELAAGCQALLALDQVDLPDTGVLTRRVRSVLGESAAAHPACVILADSRQGLKDWPPVGFKMNLAELNALSPGDPVSHIDAVASRAQDLARRNARPVIVTLSERGVVGALPSGTVEHVPCLPILGPIDIVGAGDSVMANLGAGLAAQATLREALQLAMAAAHVVIHQLGTTGTATVAQLRKALGLPSLGSR